MRAEREPELAYVLTYHDVVGPDEREAVGFPGPVAARYKLTPETFERHLDAIAATGVPVVRLDGAPPGGRAAALTFDDGGGSACTVAAALERRGWRGHFFVTTSRIGTPGFATAPELADLERRGHLVGSHSHTHPPYLGRLDDAAIDAEWATSRRLLADVLGAPPAVASLPGGFLTRSVVAAAARAGYGLLLTSEPRSGTRTAQGMTVAGRYAIWATTAPAVAGGYARGAIAPRSRLWAEWQVKTLAKRISPALYERARRTRAGSPAPRG